MAEIKECKKKMDQLKDQQILEAKNILETKKAELK